MLFYRIYMIPYFVFTNVQRYFYFINLATLYSIVLHKEHFCTNFKQVHNISMEFFYLNIIFKRNATPFLDRIIPFVFYFVEVFVLCFSNSIKTI